MLIVVLQTYPLSSKPGAPLTAGHALGGRSPRPTHPMSCIGFYTMLRPVLGISNADIGTP